MLFSIPAILPLQSNSHKNSRAGRIKREKVSHIRTSAIHGKTQRAERALTAHEEQEGWRDKHV